MKNGQSSPASAGLAALAPAYGGILCDVWGVIHNGEEAWPEAVDAFAKKHGVIPKLYIVQSCG